MRSLTSCKEPITKPPSQTIHLISWPPGCLYKLIRHPFLSLKGRSLVSNPSSVTWCNIFYLHIILGVVWLKIEFIESLKSSVHDNRLSVTYVSYYYWLFQIPLCKFCICAVSIVICFCQLGVSRGCLPGVFCTWRQCCSSDSYTT